MCIRRQVAKGWSLPGYGGGGRGSRNAGEGLQGMYPRLHGTAEWQFARGSKKVRRQVEYDTNVCEATRALEVRATRRVCSRRHRVAEEQVQ